MSTMENPKQPLESIIGSTADVRRMLRAQIEAAEKFIADTRAYLENTLGEQHGSTQAVDGPEKTAIGLKHMDAFNATKQILAMCGHSLTKEELINKLWDAGVRTGSKESEKQQRGTIRASITQNVNAENLLAMPGDTVGLIAWKDDPEKYMRRS